MQIPKFGAALGLAAGIVLALSSSTQAQTPEEFYKDNTLTVIISARAGGTADTLGRIVAPYFGKHLPGQPQVVVMNKPGAGGMKAASELMLTEKKDGSVIAFLQRNNLISALVRDKHDQFDPRVVKWIGNLKREPYVLVAMADSDVKTADDVFEKEMVLAATGFTNENRTLSTMMNDHLGAKFKIVPGYTGSGMINKAMEAGEVEGWMHSLETAFRGTEKQWLDEGRMNLIMLLAWQRLPDLPDLPALGEYVKDDSLKPMLDFFLAPLDVGRPFAVPGEVPEDRLAALRQAFDDAMADPEMIAEMEKLNQTVSPISGQEVEAIIAELYKTPGAVLEQAREILIEKK